MTAPPSNAAPSQLFAPAVKALRDEREKLQSVRREITLFDGEFLGGFAGHFAYRFELPEDFTLRGVDRVSCSFSQLQPVDIEGQIISLESQFVLIALPMDFGMVVPELGCRWDYDGPLSFVSRVLEGIPLTHPVTSVLLEPGKPENSTGSSSEPILPKAAFHEQADALKKIAQNRVSYLWGPTRTGKTFTLALAALNALKAGKSVLWITATASGADDALAKILSNGQELGVTVEGVLTRAGLPATPASVESPSFYLEQEIETKRSDKKKELEEGVSLLRAYWKTKVHQYLHEDFYSRLTELRERTNENKKQLEKVRDEITGLKDLITRAQNASMLDKLKKTFSKEEVSAAQKQLSEKQLLQKKLQPLQQALTTELMRMEAQSPIDGNELKEYQTAVKRIGELGGVKKLADDVESKSAVDEASLLSAKRCVIVPLNNYLSDERLHSGKYDLVLIDDAAMMSPAHLVAVSSAAKESLVVAGNPFQLGPESLARTDEAMTWLQQDVFLMLARTEHLDDLYEWAKKNSQWCLPLTTQVAFAPKLARFRVSFFFRDRIHIQDQPGARGTLVLLDSGDLKSSCKQYIGKKSLIPYNDLQTKRTIDVVKYALAKSRRIASDIGIIVPLQGTTLYTKLHLRLQGIRNVEVGLPVHFQGRTKKTIIVDLTMAGVDYTMRPLDDRKIGEHKLLRALHTMLSSVEEDLYIIADVGHFKSVYKDRVISRFLMQVQGQSDATPPLTVGAKAFDEMPWDQRDKVIGTGAVRSTSGLAARPADTGVNQHRDVETELRMKMLARQQPVSIGRDFEHETYLASLRVLGLRKDVNLLSQMIGGDLLFRYSLGTEEAAARLPLDGCRNEEEFRRTMERWNLLIYDMSGAGKTDLTYFAKQTPEAKVRWDINNLRAYYSSAMEAVMEESKHRIATSVNKVFQECLGKSQPANPVDWSTAYLNFLGKMEAYLAWISEQLRR